MQRQTKLKLWSAYRATVLCLIAAAVFGAHVYLRFFGTNNGPSSSKWCAAVLFVPALLMIYWACYTMAKNHAKDMKKLYAGNYGDAPLSLWARIIFAPILPVFPAIDGSNKAANYQVKKHIITKGADDAAFAGKIILFLSVSISCMAVAGCADRNLRNGTDPTNLLIAEAVLLGLLFLMIVAEAIRVDYVLTQKEIGKLNDVEGNFENPAVTQGYHQYGRI